MHPIILCQVCFSFSLLEKSGGHLVDVNQSNCQKGSPTVCQIKATELNQAKPNCIVSNPKPKK